MRTGLAYLLCIPAVPCRSPNAMPGPADCAIGVRQSVILTVFILIRIGAIALASRKINFVVQLVRKRTYFASVINVRDHVARLPSAQRRTSRFARNA